VNGPPVVPNIIWVFADQLRGQALGHAGDPNVRTPHIDRLAATGVRFTAACATYPVCVPFRFSLLTGEYAHSRWVPTLDWRMSPAERTIAHELGDAGYDTIYVGKWHLNGSIPPGDARAINRQPVAPGFRGGFREWHGFNLRNGYFDTCVFHGDDETPVALPGYQTDGLFDIALDCLRRRGVSGGDRTGGRRRPFFLALSVEAPHPPHEAPEADLRRLRARRMRPRPNVRDAPPDDGAEYPRSSRAESFGMGIAEAMAAYYAQVENLDANVGRLLQVLDDVQLADETVVMFFSDHGELLGSHGMRSKQDPREESINIPLLVAGPGCQPARVDDVVCTEDLYPTTLGLAGLAARATGKPGLDLAPIIRGERAGTGREAVYLELVAEHRPGMLYHGQPWRGLRTRRHKYTVLSGKPWHLFDLEDDPYEQHNLVGSPAHTPLLRQMHAHLSQLVEETADSYTMGQPPA
jgi:arylsulfatase A-like enzyme